jgi:hypothetical protein
MNQLDRQLPISLKSQYLASIDEIIIECEHVYRSTIDYELMNLKIEQLFAQALSEGLEEKFIWDLLHARIPSYVNYVNYTKQNVVGKKAA